MRKYKTIGILGGMGPEATAELYFRIIRIFQKEYGAKYDADFPEMIVINLPIPDVVENPQEEKSVEKMLIWGVKKLETAGAEFVVMPCNTVTCFLPAMQEAVSIPILSILEETAREVQKAGIKVVGIIGTEMTIRRNIYGKALGNIKLIVPDITQQKATTGIIMNILEGKKESTDKRFLLQLISALKNLGAEKVILGCTELPLLIKKNINTINNDAVGINKTNSSKINRDIIDTLGVLARATVKEAVGYSRMKI